MNKLILVRHSQSDARADVPTHEWGLTAEGHRRADALARLLEDYVPFSLASSPEPKAHQTAQAIAKQYGLEITTLADLREHDRRTVKWADSQDEFRANVIRFFQHPDQLVLGEETATQALARFTDAIGELESIEHNVVAVTHGSVITLFAARFAKVEPVTFWESMTQPCFVVFSRPDYELIEVVSDIE